MSTEIFSNLIGPNLAPIRRFIHRRLHPQDHVEDVLQRTLLLAFLHRNDLRTPSKFKSWLWSIAMNEIRMFLRSARRHISLGELTAFEVADSVGCPFLRCAASERQAGLRAAIRRLRPRDQATINYELQGLSLSETAPTMDVTIAAAKSARFRARRRLLEAMRESVLPAL
jgi:RNA polymerase sigma-70 factor (ECF subfamily)